MDVAKKALVNVVDGLPSNQQPNNSTDIKRIVSILVMMD